MSSNNPREAAFLCLKEILLKNTYSQIALKEWADKANLKGKDRKLFWEIVLGTLRWLNRIDYGLSRQIKRYKRLPEEVKILLRLGYYQIVILDRIPPYSAVNESVEIAKKMLPQKFHKFTNAVLRKAARLPYPVVKGELSCDEVASIALSHPQWLVQRWRKCFGIEEAVRLMRSNLKPAPYSIWVNIHYTDVNAVRKTLRESGIECRPLKHMEKEMLEVLSTVDLTEHPLYKEGLITAQDLASRLVVKVLNPLPGETVLDACAAPGIKTAQIALAMENSGRVVACEINPERHHLMRENLSRLGAAIVETVLDDVIAFCQQIEDETFDKILVDAPCSDLGTVRRRPEIKWRRSPEDVERFSQKQRQILDAVIPKLKKGGELVYSVCSIEKEETEEILNYLLSKHSLEPIPFDQLIPESLAPLGAEGHALFLPHKTNSDGFFITKLRRL